MEKLMSRPNILLITSDQQHNSTLGAVNDRIQTPALDRLCAEGMRFDRAYCPNPTCTPTRASILTGMYPSQHGAWALGTKLSEHAPTIGGILHEGGYVTSLTGKAHFQPLASRPGMESIECHPTLRNLDFWRDFHGPWYGFDHVETARMHACEHLVGGHYAQWMEEQGFTQWREYFEEWPCTPESRERFRSSHRRHWNLPEEYHYTRWTGDRTVAQLEQAAEVNSPFFVWASFHDPHPPYLVPEPWASMYDPTDMQPGTLLADEHDANPIHFRMAALGEGNFKERFPEEFAIHGGHSHLHDVEELKKDMAVYYGMVSFLDRQVGRILDRLDALGLAENTLVIYTTDHGHFLGQHGLIAKCIHHYEDLLRVPFLARWPGHTPAGQTSDALMNLVDLAPTFCTAARVDAPGTMTGVNQLDVLQGGKAVRRGTIIENRHTHNRYFHLRTYVNQQYKITIYEISDDGELFDLVADPEERRNLWHEPAAREIKEKLLLEFLQETLACEVEPMHRIASA